MLLRRAVADVSRAEGRLGGAQEVLQRGWTRAVCGGVSFVAQWTNLVEIDKRFKHDRPALLEQAARMDRQRMEQQRQQAQHQHQHAQAHSHPHQRPSERNSSKVNQALRGRPSRRERLLAADGFAAGINFRCVVVCVSC